METMRICMLCLGIKENLCKLAEFNSSEICLRVKLEKCVPEIGWKNDYSICPTCCEQLENVYNFRELCLKSEKARCELWHEITNFALEKKQNIKPDNSTKIPEDGKTNINAEEEEIVTVSCFHCEEQFSKKTLLERHIDEQHTKLEKYYCRYCCKQYLNQNVFKKHMQICNTLESLKQSECLQEGEVKVELDEEIDLKDEQKDENELQQCDASNECDVCGASFNNKYLLKRHRKNVHATEKKFKCDQCPSTFVSPVYLNAHKKYHSRDRKHVCLFCGKRYITASDLYHHEKIHKNKRAYKCIYCNKAFNTSSDLHKHKICVHTDRNLWKYSCEYCLRKFPLKTNLDSHVKTHTGEKNFSCHLCDKKYISRSALTRHINSHNDVKSFKCKLCSFGYKYKKSLEIHMVKNHGEGDVKIPERVRNYICHICPKSYCANSKLQRHIRSHTGDKPFKCPSCDKCFVDKSYIKQHLRAAHCENV